MIKNEITLSESVISCDDGQYVIANNINNYVLYQSVELVTLLNNYSMIEYK